MMRQQGQMQKAKQAEIIKSERLAQLEASETVRNEQLETLIKAQQSEMAHLWKEQAEMHEKLLASVEKGAASGAEDSAATVQAVADGRVVQLQRQLDAKDAEMKGTIAGAAFAAEQLRDRKAADKLAETRRDAEGKQLAALEEQCSQQSDEIMRLRVQADSMAEALTNTKVEMAVLKQGDESSEAAGVAAKDAAKLAVDQGMEWLKQQLHATQSELTTSREFGKDVMLRCSQLDAIEKTRNEAQEKTTQSQQEELQKLLRTLSERELKNQELAAEVAAWRDGDADSVELIQTAVDAAKAAMASNGDDRVRQLENKVAAKDAQLAAAAAAAALAEQALRAASSSKDGEETSRAAESERYTLLIERYQALEDELRSTRATADTLHGEERELRSKLSNAEQALAVAISGDRSSSAAEHAASTVAKFARDEQVAALENGLREKDVELRSARDTVSQLTHSLLQLEHQDDLRSGELFEQLKA
eukprot:SAG11_NODE_4646_length_1822_cov_1.353453_2_plen_476_part_01